MDEPDQQGRYGMDGLAGLTVIELSASIRAASCGRLLRQWGAGVVKVELPEAAPPAWERAWLDAGKQSVLLDWRTAEGAGRLRELALRADLLLEDQPPGLLERHGIAFAALSAANRGLIQTSITDFGSAGPWAARPSTDLIVSALSGIAWLNGVGGGSPLREPGNQTGIVAALAGAIGTLAALEHRHVTGRGQQVDVSALEAVASVLSPSILQHSYQQANPPRRTAEQDSLFDCADGQISLILAAQRAWETLVAVWGLEVDPQDERFNSDAGRRANQPALRELLRPLLLQKTRAELFAELSTLRVVSGMLLHPAELPADPHLVERGSFVPLAGDSACPAGRLVPGPSFRLAGERPPAEARAPAPGEHTESVLRSLAGPATSGARSVGSKRLPLEHVRIVDLTQAWAGAYATQLLADLGARVIKIESRTRPDPWRGGFGGSRGLRTSPVEGPGEHPYNRSYLANSVNRNKDGITLDLETDEGRTLFLDLVRGADIVAENFTPRVLPNLELAYQRLCKVRPGIILLSMPAFGLSGPYHEYPGIGGTVEPMSGNCALLGQPGGRPQTSGVMYSDAVAGLNGACALLTALSRRNQTGQGCHLELSQHEAMIAMLGEFFAHGDPAGLGRLGNADRQMAPHGIYRCAGEDEWIAIAVRDDEDWQRLLGLCAEMPGLPERLARDSSERLAERATLDGLLSEWLRDTSAVEIEARLLGAGIPAARVRSIAGLQECPQLMARGFLLQVQQPDGLGPHTMAGMIARLSESPGAVRRPAPEHGQQSRQVLSELLGIDDATLDALEARGITGRGETQPAARGDAAVISGRGRVR